ncbi:FecR family protein [Rhodohalobacter sp. 614A]|uniref:FecR family protein n=1 Tax=Rhodohalobacter sp. 614A TaxID=2908649 RepID=UPI001F1FC45C|nr:FecR domain-containing protein [Rhodohalobacter sp. 614A]
MDSKKPNIRLLKAYLDGNCTNKEIRQVEQWLDQSPENIDFLEGLLNPDENLLTNFNKKKVKAGILEKIQGEDYKDLQVSTNRKVVTTQMISHSMNFWGSPQKAWMFRAAAIILVVATSLMTVWLMDVNEEASEPFFSQVTSPVRTITTRTLPDGTRVELNANSTLKYPSSFSASERNVYLEGEAFFDVESDKKRPFKVHSGQLTTTVLGTEFNVKYIPELGDVEVALVEGRVQVGVADKKSLSSSVTLEPNQWVRYSSTDNQMAVGEGIQTKILWREGILEFKDNTLTEVASTLQNWYGVEILIDDSAANEIKVTGTFENESLEHVLETLNFVAGIEYKMERNTDNEVDKVILSSKE